MNIKNEAETRGVLLSLLYANKDHSWATVKPGCFSPPIAKREILCIGRDFHKAGLIEEFPLDNGDYYFMRISLLGQAVWEGRAQSLLEIDVPPS